jgi:hypothetical protein
LVFFGLVQFGDSPALAHLFSMHAFLKPVGDEGAWVDRGVPWALGAFLL